MCLCRRLTTDKRRRAIENASREGFEPDIVAIAKDFVGSGEAVLRALWSYKTDLGAFWSDQTVLNAWLTEMGQAPIN